MKQILYALLLVFVAMGLSFLRIAASPLLTISSEHFENVDQFTYPERSIDISSVTVGLETNFGNNEIPADWMVTELGDPGHTWLPSSNLIWINSWQNEGFHVAGELISPVIDCSDMDIVLLGIHINYFFYPFPEGMTDAEIRYSIDGVNWETFFVFTQSMGGTVLPYYEWDITSVASGEENFYLKFWFDDQEEHRAFWQIGSVIVYSPNQPEFSIEPAVTEWDFGTVILGQTSDPQTFTIRNIGSDMLQIQYPILDNNSAFTLQYSFDSFPASLQFNESVSFNVRFQPNVAGENTATLSIAYTEIDDDIYQIELIGDGYDPTITEYPWTEIFQQFEFPPLGWIVVNGVENAQWHGNGVYSFVGSRSARATYGPSTGYNANEWLISPPLDLDHPDAELLYFYFRSTWTSDDWPASDDIVRLEIWLLDEITNDADELTNMGELISVAHSIQDWRRHSIDIRPYSGTKYIAFRYVVNETGGWNQMYLDYVNIKTMVEQTLTVVEPIGDEGFVTPEPGEHAYYFGEEAYIKADVDYTWAWRFDRWELDGNYYSNNPDTLIVMDDDYFLQAFFVPDLVQTLNMKAPVGEGNTIPNQGLYEFANGTVVSIQATPAPGWEFSHWEANGVYYSEQPSELITMSSSVEITAIFGQSDGYQVTFSVKDQDGNSIQNAVITVAEQTNEAGNYVFYDVGPGVYDYSISADGFLKTGGELIVAEQDMNVEIVLETLPDNVFTVEFVIQNEAAAEIDDAVIIFNGYANVAGDYVFENIPPGSFDYIVVRSGFFHAQGTVEIVDADITNEVVLFKDGRLFFEDFSANVQPGGWQVFIHGDAGFGWSFTDEKAYITPNLDHFVSASLVSPPIDVSQAGALTLGMKHFYNPYGETHAEIRASTDGLTWTTIKSFGSDSEGDLFIPYLEYPVSSLIDHDDVIYLAFFYSSNNSFNSFFNWTIDEVVLLEPVDHQFLVEPVSPNLYIESGGSSEYIVSVFNYGGFDDVYDIELVSGEWSYSFPDILAVSQGTTELLNIQVAVPADLNMGVRDTLQLVFTSQGDPELSYLLQYVTVSVAPISDYYYEDFDVVAPPTIPGGWYKRENTDAFWAGVNTEINPSFDPVSSPNNLRINNSNDTEAELILISPPLDNEIHISDFRTRFWLRTGGNTAVIVGTMPHPDGPFNPVTELTSMNHFTWEQFMVSFEDHDGDDKHIAFKQKAIQNFTAVSVDDIHIELLMAPIFDITKAEHDFGDNWIDVESDPVEFTIRNTGHFELIINDLNLDNSDDFILQFPANMLPVSLAWNEEFHFNVIFKPSVEGEVNGVVSINYFEDGPDTFDLPLSGIGNVRPPGSTCDNPIFIDLPIVDYHGSTKDFHRDYFYNYIHPPNWFMHGNDKVFVFTIDELSFLSGSISGPWASVFILAACPNPNNPPQVLAGALSGTQFDTFQDVIFLPGDYFAVVSSNHVNPPLHTNFVLNLSSEPLPDFHQITFQVVEASDEQMPLAGVRLYIEGDYMSGNIYTDEDGIVVTELLEGDYSAEVFLQNYQVKNIDFGVYENQHIVIQLTDLIWTPSDLYVATDELDPGQALFGWSPKPLGDPWTEGFENDFPPEGWYQIINNDGALDPETDGVDWQFTWQQYGIVNFLDLPVHPKEGQKQAFVHWSNEPQDEWLITKPFTAPADDLVFWYFGRNGLSNQDFFLKISVDDGENWIPLWNASDLPFGANHYDFPAIVDLTYYGGETVRLAWNAVGPFGLISAFLLDDITVGDMRINIEDLEYLSKSDAAPMPGNPELSTVASHRLPDAVERVQFEDMGYDNNRARVLTGFDVFLNDMENPVASAIQETSYLFTDLPQGDHIAGVRALYTTGVSEIASIEFTSEGVPSNSLTFIITDMLGQSIHDAIITLNGIQYEPGQYVFEDIDPGLYTYSIHTHCFIAESGEAFVDGHLTVNVTMGHLPGDANGDGIINVLDLIAIATSFVGDTPDGFCPLNADANADGQIDILDIIFVVNMFSENKASFRHINSEKAHLYLNEKGITIESDGTLAGIQFILEGHSDAVELKLELKNHQMIHLSAHGQTRIMIFSLSNTPIPAGRTKLLSFGYEANSASVNSVKAGNISAVEVPVIVHNELVTGVGMIDEFIFTAYPNPVADVLWVEYFLPSGAFNLSLLNIHGQLIESITVKNEGHNVISVDVKDYPSGVYILRVDFSGHTFTERIILE